MPTPTPLLRGLLSVAAVFSLSAVAVRAADPAPSVTLNWLGGTPPVSGTGVSWGVPWPRGTVHLRDPLVLTGSDGREIRMQTWPLAYWPDGSLKWTGQAISSPASLAGPFQISVRASAAPEPTVQNRNQARERSSGDRIAWNATGSLINIDTGPMRCRILKHDTSVVFDGIWAGDTEIAEHGRLVLLVSDQPGTEDAGTVTTEEYVSRIDKVTLEQGGPVRATVKIEGTHVSAKTGRALLPFVVRLYFYAGQPSIRMVHSVVYDADDRKDFIRGLGMEFDVPLREEVQNRHVRLAGDSGMWAEPVKPLVGRRVVSFPGRGDIFPSQLAGRPIPAFGQFPAQQQEDIANAADWNDYRLTQLHPDGFTIEKRTHAENSWVHVLDGRRSPGLVFLGDTSGGVAAVIRDFWQKDPVSVEVRGATTPEGQVRLWFWSPQAAPMDMRHYDTVAHGLEMAYEDVEPGFSTPYGIANTSEVTLWALPSVPANADLVRMERTADDPALLVCTPEYYHSNRTFGIWSLPDRSTPVRAGLEDQLDAGLSFYQHEIDQRSWYGFWNYGDMMRMYDEVRHEWRYDIGGWAWNNTELMPNLWLWYSFLRTGRSDVFRMAEAMTRQTQEVDCYHIGRFKGLGSRHNVSHWGDGAKQPRISNASLKNIYYYLTTDERTGDLLHEVVDADFSGGRGRSAAGRPAREHLPHALGLRLREHLARLRDQLDDRVGADAGPPLARQDPGRHEDDARDRAPRPADVDRGRLRPGDREVLRRGRRDRRPCPALRRAGDLLPADADDRLSRVLERLDRDGQPRRRPAPGLRGLRPEGPGDGTPGLGRAQPGRSVPGGVQHAACGPSPVRTSRPRSRRSRAGPRPPATDSGCST